MILVIGHIKGGVGKTMLAINLAIARSGMGSDVLLINGDEQRTAMQFTNLRAELIGKAGYTAVTLLGSSLRTQVRHLTQKYDDIIIDVGGGIRVASELLYWLQMAYSFRFSLEVSISGPSLKWPNSLARRENSTLT